MSCYTVSAIDKSIAAKVEGWNPHMVATLRGMYDELNPDSKIETLGIEQAVDTLLKLRASLRRKHSKEAAGILGKGSKKPFAQILTDSYANLRANFSAEERFDRINMLSQYFSRIVDIVQNNNPQYSREEIISGVKFNNGDTILGIDFIFDKLYDTILTNYDKARLAGNDEAVAKWQKVLDNWSALVVFTKVNLKNTEGIKLGITSDFAVQANEEDFGDNLLEELFTLEESTRESWQELNDCKSAFGNIGQTTRRFLSKLPLIQDGQIAKDDLGFTKYVNPVFAHQSLMQSLRGITSEVGMAKKLQQLAESIEWIRPIAEYFNIPVNFNSPQTYTEEQRANVSKYGAFAGRFQIRTAFYCDFKKNFQLYCKLQESSDTKSGLRDYKTIIMNRTNVEALYKQFLARISLSRNAATNYSIFDREGNVNFENLDKLQRRIRQVFIKEAGNLTAKEPDWYAKAGTADYMSPASRNNTIRYILTALGIDVDIDTVKKILADRVEAAKLITIIKQLASEAATGGLSAINTKAIREAGITYKKALREQTSYLENQRDKYGNLEKSIRNLITVVAKNKKELRVENKALWKNSKGRNISMFSNVNPSYLGDFMDKIHAFVEEGDVLGLKRWLEEKHLNNPYFAEKNPDGTYTIYNKWLEELYNSTSAENSFATLFNYKRLMGIETKSAGIDFENFTEKQHALDMIHEFNFADNTPGYANYPVFILGDSGVAKYLKAKKYTESEILDGMLNVWRQEIQRMKTVKAINETLAKGDSSKGIKSYKSITNFRYTENEYTLLPFLNEEEYSKKLQIDEKTGLPTEDSVKEVIRQYMENSFAKFSRKMKELGLTETLEKDSTKSVYFNQLLKGKTTIDQLFRDFYYNTKFATIQQLQMFTIDPAFYGKETKFKTVVNRVKDLQKRYKEIHAPGLALSPEARDFDGQFYGGILLDGNNNPVLDEYGNPLPNTKERCVYFEDIELPATKDFLEALKANGISTSDYVKNTLTDGQGYRTLESYRKVMGMAGKWTRSMEDAYNQIKAIRSKYGYNIPTDAKQLEEYRKDMQDLARMAVRFQPIKPYMYTFEQFQLGEGKFASIPVQHKYAEAVLIPELLPDNSKLKQMALWMERKGIDMVASTKAVKVGDFGATNIKDKDGDDFIKALDNGYVHVLNYSDYRIQTNVPEHIHQSRLFGTQIRKIIMSGLHFGEAYNDYYSKYFPFKHVNLGKGNEKAKITPRNLVAFYNALIIAQIRNSLAEFEQLVDSPEKLSTALIQSAINNGREGMDNLQAYALTGDKKFALPLFEGALSHDSFALLSSLFKKKVNKQTINGGSAVQVSAFGIKDSAEDGDLQYVVDPNNKNNILYAECEIPFVLSWKDENGNETFLNFDDWCNADGTLKLSNEEITPEDERYSQYVSYKKDGKVFIPLIEQAYPGILSLVAYRIPTERDYSMINLQVKRFSRPEAGGTIKVPVQGTTIAGFDFDVDKLYFIRKEFQKKKSAAVKEDHRSEDKLLAALFGRDVNVMQSSEDWEEYDNTLTAQENSPAAINNMIFHIIRQRLMDPETMKARYTPGGFANASNAARFLRELVFGDLKGLTTSEGEIAWNNIEARMADKNADPEPNYDPSDPLTILTYNQQNQVAGKLIGIFANQNTNHAFASLMRTFALRSPISFAGHNYSDMLTAPEGIDVDTNMAEFLAASVDAVKDPVLNFLNLNTITADCAAVLARLGYTTKEIGLLFNQPIIKEICDYAFNNGISAKAAISAIINRYAEENQLTNKIIYNPSNGTIDLLAKNIISERKAREAGKTMMDDKNFVAHQIALANLFSDIYETTEEVTQFVQSTRFTAANAVGSTPGDFYAQQMKVNKYLSKLKESKKKSKVLMQVNETMTSPIINSPVDILSDDYANIMWNNPFGYEQAMYDANVKFIQLISKYYPYETLTYKNARTALAMLSSTETLNADEINDAHNLLLVHLLNQQEAGRFNPRFRLAGKNTTAEDYYTNRFARECFDVLEKNPELKALPIFQYMEFNVEDEEKVSMNIQNVGGLDTTIKDSIKDSWADLYKSNPQLAEDLFLYNFYKAGFDFNPFTFMNMAPTELKQNIVVNTLRTEDGTFKNITYVDFLNEIQAGRIVVDPEKFAKEFVLNNLTNYKFVAEPKSKAQRDTFRNLIYQGSSRMALSFEVNQSNTSEEEYKMFCNRKVDDVFYFKPVVVYGEWVYVAQGDSGFAASSTGAITYTSIGRISPNNSNKLAPEVSASSTTQEVRTSESSQGTSIPEDNSGTVQRVERVSFITELVDRMIQRDVADGQLMAEEVPQVKQTRLNAFLATETKDFIDTAKALLEEFKLADVYTLDSEGNIIKACK